LTLVKTVSLNAHAIERSHEVLSTLDLKDLIPFNLLFANRELDAVRTRTRVKICGITQVEDAQTVVSTGADAIGLVFYPKSSRFISIEKAIEITRAVPAFVTIVGLFLDARQSEVDAVLQRVPLGLLQFHGDECPADCNVFGLPYIKAIGMQGLSNLQAYADTYADASGLLLDSHVVGEAGGTGQTFDWSTLPQDFNRPIILAGGLTPANVAEAIQAASPYAVDLSSGVELAPGIKDAEKIKALMQEVRRVDNEL
jgi:phosphoribosylanthranilate isomerase